MAGGASDFLSSPQGRFLLNIAAHFILYGRASLQDK
jgi:hypothetical protein